VKICGVENVRPRDIATGVGAVAVITVWAILAIPAILFGGVIMAVDKIAGAIQRKK